ncbi:plasmid mobilization protein [uncultured Megasphaera sp.]|uniref:plasmid mobilization protein n=1 Tax=uncultured Megasphaera sp. TaxID=165188 RepID=UPI00266D5181|nr:hypothetical protein [uncultured Megasphaera sp.]
MEEKEKRKAISISLTKHEQDMLREKAQAYGLSVSAFIRLAAKVYPEEVEMEKKQNTEHAEEVEK